MVNCKREHYGTTKIVTSKPIADYQAAQTGPKPCRGDIFGTNWAIGTRFSAPGRVHKLSIQVGSLKMCDVAFRVTVTTNSEKLQNEPQNELSSTHFCMCDSETWQHDAIYACTYFYELNKFCLCMVSMETSEIWYFLMWMAHVAMETVKISRVAH